MPSGNCDRYYHILDLEPGATLSEVKDAWRVLSQIWHPDRQQRGSKAYAKALEKQKQINDAYDYLKSFLQEKEPQKAPPPNTPPRNANASRRTKDSSTGAPPEDGFAGGEPPKDSAAGGNPPPDWTWPPPGPGQSGSDSPQWKQREAIQFLVRPLAALFDLADYEGKAVYDQDTGTMDFLLPGSIDKLCSFAAIAFAIFILLPCFCLGVTIPFAKLAEYLLPGVAFNTSLGLIVGCGILYLVNQWLHEQVTIYKGTQRPVLKLYHVGESEAIQIISRTLNEFELQHYVLGDTVVKHKGKVVALEAPLTGKDHLAGKQNQAALSLFSEIWPVEGAVLIKFTFLVRSPGNNRHLSSLILGLLTLLELNLQQRDKANR